MKNKNFKLLYVHNADFSSFSANRIQVLNMCQAFYNIGIDVTLLSFNCNKEIIKKVYGYDIKYNLTSLKPVSNNYHLRSLQLFFHFLKIKDNFDNIFTRNLTFAYLVTRFSKEKKIIYELHEINENTIWLKMFKNCLNYLKAVVTVSTNNIRYFKNYNSSKFIFLPNAVDIKKFNINFSKEEIRDLLKLPKNKILVTYVGSLQKWKGYDTFLKSYNYLENKGNILYLIVGAKKNQISALKNMYKNIIFIPFVENYKIPLFLKASDILIIPNSSKYEISLKYTSPLKLFEYMASKRPIIASNLPSIKNIVNEDEVLFFEPDNEKDLASKIEFLISNKNLQEKLAKNAYKKVKNYTWNKRAKKIVDIFLDISNVGG